MNRKIHFAHCDWSASLQSVEEPNHSDETWQHRLGRNIIEHYKPVPSEIVRQYRFNTRVHRLCIRAVWYGTVLQFGDNLGTMLKDHLVCGINDKLLNIIC